MTKMKKVVAMLLSLAMVLGMNLTVFAGQLKDGVASKGDTAQVKIEGITGGAKVELYQIASGEYGPSGEGLIRYNYDKDITALSAQPTSAEINKAHQEIMAKGLSAVDKQNGITGTYTSKELPVGVYIAIISEASDDSVYNPVLLSVSYNKDGELVTGDVTLTDGYIYGSTAVAKQTTPRIDKEIVGGTTPDGDKDTVGIGDVVTYQITPTMPSYPENAKNKTFFVSDEMSEGLTFLFETLTISVDNQTVTTSQDDDVITYVINEKTIATAAKVGNGFYLNFEYDALVINDAVCTPIVTYKAVLNEKAVVGGDGNPNDAEMYYANKPNEGNTHDFKPDEPEKPKDDAEGIKKVEDQETVYTYQLAFLKKGEGDDVDSLEGAVFGIYDEDEALIDVVTTNENGIAASTKVKAGTYTIKELVAPTGYALNDKTYQLTATWATSTSTVTVSSTQWKYTTDAEASSDGVQVGWIKDGIFYAMDEYSEETAEEAGVLPAYTVYENTTYESTTITESNTPGSGTAASLIEVGKADNDGKVDFIPNTKMSALPSTGGIGTTIFTIGGCLIMIAAAGLFFASRRKAAK